MEDVCNDLWRGIMYVSAKEVLEQEQSALFVPAGMLLTVARPH